MRSREQIACELLGLAGLDAGGCAPCPGRHKHTKGSGRRDFRVVLDGAPTGFCFHSSCSAEVEAFNDELRRRIWREENGTRPVSPYESKTVAPEPHAPRALKRPPLDLEKLQRVARTVKDPIDRDWLMARSAIPVRPGMRDCGADFLEHLYAAGEKILIFTQFKSQGQFGYVVGRGGWRLASQRGVPAVKSDLPLGGPDGVWFLCNPVTGEWRKNESAVSRGGESRYGRRHGACVTRWPYLVLENDEAPQDLWLKFLVQLPLPIVAIYTSGGKSVHALLRLQGAADKTAWDRERDAMLALMAPMGADPAAMTAVRLTRLPGCMRGDRLQELWYLNPRARQGQRILDQREVRR